MNSLLSEMSNPALLEIIKQSTQATAIYIGPELIIQLANEGMLKFWGKDDSVIGKRFEDALPELEGQPFAGLIKQVWTSGQMYTDEGVEAILEIDGKLISSYFDFVYKPIFDTDGTLLCILHTASDVTERVKAWKLVGEKEEYEQQVNEELAVLNEELQTTNEELQTTNEELSMINEEYTSTNEQLEEFNQLITTLNLQLEEKNDHLISSNLDYKKANLDLNTANNILERSNTELKTLNDAITALNNKLSDSESGFRNLIAQAPMAMLLLKGDDFIVTMINGPMLELLGRDETIIGKPLFKEIPELVGQGAADKLIETYRDGLPRAESSSPVNLFRNGKLTEGFFNFSYAPYMEDNKVTGVIDMALEVTDQVVAEQRLQGILETMAEGVGIIDTTGQLVYANPMAQQILGLTLSDIEDRTYNDPRWQNLRLDGSPLPEEEHPMSIMMSTGRPVFDMEIAVERPDGDRFYVSINAAPIIDKQGNLTGGIGTFMDVTSRRLITQDKDDFISIASHELKTPVTSLKASLQMLERSHHKLPDESRAKLIGQSIRSLDNLSRLINDLLDTSRMDQGQIKIEKTWFSIDQLFQDCCSHIAQSSKQEIIFEGEKARTIFADNQQIGQVLVNFITNAIKYAPNSDKIVVKASVTADNEIKIAVKDTGPGIPQEKVGHLFNRYYRTDYNGQKFTGLGLGLYISAEIIKNHGGKIGVDSEVGTGSEFWFSLPLTPHD